MRPDGEIITVTIKPVDFRNAKGYRHSNLADEDCPLANALRREGYIHPDGNFHVGYHEVEVDGKVFKIPINIWGEGILGKGTFDTERIDHLVALSKWRIPFTIPTITLVLEEI